VIEITEQDFSVDEVIGRMAKPEVGAVITYLGTVRCFSIGREVEGVEFDASEAVVDRLRGLEKKALEGSGVEDVVIVHRIGKLKVGDKILLVAVSASHRQPAFTVCMSIIDAIKSIHFTWKREVYRSS